jgi:hypothetical protein
LRSISLALDRSVRALSVGGVGRGGRGVFRCERRGSNSMGALFFVFVFRRSCRRPFSSHSTSSFSLVPSLAPSKTPTLPSRPSLPPPPPRQPSPRPLTGALPPLPPTVGAAAPASSRLAPPPQRPARWPLPRPPWHLPRRKPTTVSSFVFREGLFLKVKGRGAARARVEKRLEKQ